ncbi:MAG TPA: TonB-dependent receptor, partial [Vicinamibacterales bacterium]|nr:TonB-dependent receptor [Vicinamibacterales bacterium]
MKCIARLFALLFAATLIAGAAQAQTLTGTVQGTVTDEQGAILPGATATLTGPRGAQTTVSDEHGEYRFVGVTPGTYRLRLELSGFAPQEVEEVVVGIGKTAVSDFTLKVSGLTETVEVIGTSSTVDVKSSSTDTTVSSNMLQMTPLYSSTATGLLNAAPGINSSSAYGAQASYGNALLLDGVDTRDPEGGSAWTFFNQNLIEEIQIGGLGAPAEYGGFTGGIINTITKSGGNDFSGLFSVRYTRGSLASDNISD